MGTEISYSSNYFCYQSRSRNCQNRTAYQILERNFNVIYIAKSGGLFDKYPDFWENNSFVESHGNHLGGIAQLIEKKIYQEKIIPSCI